jgi:hypothetical protein
MRLRWVGTGDPRRCEERPTRVTGDFGAALTATRRRPGRVAVRASR